MESDIRGFDARDGEDSIEAESIVEEDIVEEDIVWECDGETASHQLGKRIPPEREKRPPSGEISRRIAHYEIFTARLVLDAVRKRLDKIESNPAAELMSELAEVERLLDTAKRPLREAAHRLRQERLQGRAISLGASRSNQQKNIPCPVN